MSELMTAEAFNVLFQNALDASYEYENSKSGDVEARKKFKDSEAAVVAAYSAALAAPDPRVQPLVEALEDIRAIFCIRSDGEAHQVCTRIDAALAAAKGEAAAEDAWIRPRSGCHK